MINCVRSTGRLVTILLLQRVAEPGVGDAVPAHRTPYTLRRAIPPHIERYRPPASNVGSALLLAARAPLGPAAARLLPRPLLDEPDAGADRGRRTGLLARDRVLRL